jgi:beta-lactam-binding protein with PASTA domain
MKNWIQNLALAGAAFAVLLLVIYLGLGTYTRHGEHIKVPNVVDLRPERAAETLTAANLEMQVIDSQYIPEKRPGIILSQLPFADEEVKEGRMVYLTINTVNKPTVRMPNLIDQSLTLSTALLKSRGLALGNISYQPSSEGNNLVIAQWYKGQAISEGTSLSIGSKIDLTVIQVQSSQPDSALVEGLLLN